MTLLLIILAIVAAIVVAVPDLVTIGLVALILPGVILAIIPTLFLYLLGFELIRRLAGLRQGFWHGVLAALLVLVVGCAVAAPAHIRGLVAFARAVEPQVTPQMPIRLAGHVSIEDDSAPVGRGARAQPRPCAALCAALLDTPGVTAVTVAGIGAADPPPQRYRLVAAADAPVGGVAPIRPEDILQHLPETGRLSVDAMLERRRQRRDAVVARWALRLAGPERLVGDDVREAPDLVIAIRDARPSDPHRIAIAEVTIRDRGGAVLLRDQLVTARPVMTPFAYLPESRGGLHMAFEIARIPRRSRERYLEIKPIETLFARTTLGRPDETPDGGPRMRGALEAALRDPSERVPVAALATAWLRGVDWQTVREADLAVIAALIVDPRIETLDTLYDGAARRVSPVLRAAISAWLLQPQTQPRFANRLDGLVRAMPPGTYAVALPDETALLADPALRRTAPALVERLADRGADAVPMLVSILQAELGEPWHRRQWILKAVRRALTRLGPEAAPALAAVNPLMDRAQSPLTNSWGDGQAWRLAQLRMGQPAESLGFPPTVDEASRAKAREALQRQLERYRPDRLD